MCRSVVVVLHVGAATMYDCIKPVVEMGARFLAVEVVSWKVMSDVLVKADLEARDDVIGTTVQSVFGAF
jgi:hypothetical protein